MTSGNRPTLHPRGGPTALCAVLVTVVVEACSCKAAATARAKTDAGAPTQSTEDDGCGEAVPGAARDLDCVGPLRIGPVAPAYVAPEASDLASTPTLFVVNYSHLDTQWRWAFPQTIRQFIPATIAENRSYFARFPGHVFNWSGASRYQMLEEYHPEDFRTVKAWVAAGRWFPAGNQWEECDVLVPSSESIIRQILEGSRYFNEHFGTQSQEFMLPDSFGFPASLPSILAHCGLRGFSTQKLTWNSAVGIPFHVGQWQGVDGRGVIAALDAGPYGAVHREDLSRSEYWSNRLEENGRVSGLKVDYLYNGRGDQGGAPHETSMKMLEASKKDPGPVKIVVGPSDLMFRRISDAQIAGFPSYRGDLLLTEHSAGSLTSQAFMKRLNRMNELLADAAERASVAAALIGAAQYPQDRLRHAWRLTLRSQFHDILPGTSIPAAYGYSWNDDFIAMNEFIHVLTDAVSGVARALDTRTEGVPLVLYNPLSIARTDVVEAILPNELSGADSIVATNANGEPTPTQLSTGMDGQRRVLFLASLPGDSFAVYALRSASETVQNTELKVWERGLSNRRYRVTVDNSGDISSLYDLKARRELLSAPIRFAYMTEWPSDFPAWNMDWVDRKQPPRGFVGGRSQFRILESGPVRVALQVERESEGSRFLQTIRLAAGPPGDRVELSDRIDWKSSESSLKATFALRVSNPEATYSWDLGTIRRGNNSEKQFEVPTHSWLDLTDATGDYGVSILTGAKYGSDKPSNDSLRLTLLYTPAAPDYFREQRFQDWGRHDIAYGLVGHAGDWRRGESPWQARRLEQPILAFAASRHVGTVGKTFSLLGSSNRRVAIQAIKRSEDGSRTVVRLQELMGREARTRLRTRTSITRAWELNGLEKVIAPLETESGTLRLDFLPYQLRTVGLSLTNPDTLVQRRSAAVRLEYDLDAISSNADRSDGDCDGEGTTYPAEMLPRTIQVGDIVYETGPTDPGQKNALLARGQLIDLPKGYDRIHLLAASVTGRVQSVLTIGDQPVPLDVANWSGFLGQWDNRHFAGSVPDAAMSVNNALLRVEPGYLHTDRLAW